jgi:hypothetical protein
VKAEERAATKGRPDDQPLAEPPTHASFLRHERALIRRLTTPDRVQAFLNALGYNDEPNGITLRSFREVLRTRVVHCFEAALAAAVILEQHGYPPLIMSLESVDDLDHTLFVYRHGGRWGAVGRARDPRRHGRRPLLPTPRARARS